MPIQPGGRKRATYAKTLKVPNCPKCSTSPAPIISRSLQKYGALMKATTFLAWTPTTTGVPTSLVCEANHANETFWRLKKGHIREQRARQPRTAALMEPIKDVYETRRFRAFGKGKVYWNILLSLSIMFFRHPSGISVNHSSQRKVHLYCTATKSRWTPGEFKLRRRGQGDVDIRNGWNSTVAFRKFYSPLKIRKRVILWILTMTQDGTDLSTWPQGWELGDYNIRPLWTIFFPESFGERCGKQYPTYRASTIVQLMRCRVVSYSIPSTYFFTGIRMSISKKYWEFLMGTSLSRGNIHVRSVSELV